MVIFFKLYLPFFKPSFSSLATTASLSPLRNMNRWSFFIFISISVYRPPCHHHLTKILTLSPNRPQSAQIIPNPKYSFFIDLFSNFPVNLPTSSSSLYFPILTLLSLYLRPPFSLSSIFSRLTLFKMSQPANQPLADMESLISLVKKMQRACTTLGNHG